MTCGASLYWSPEATCKHILPQPEGTVNNKQSGRPKEVNNLTIGRTKLGRDEKNQPVEPQTIRSAFFRKTL